MIALDTNLLVYAHRAGAAEHSVALRAVERACADEHGCGVTIFNLTELWSVVTHPRMPGRASSPREASGFIRQLVDEAGVLVWSPGVGFTERLAQLATELGVKGPRIFDVQIALTAFEHGAHELWTHDEHFTTLPGLRVHDPLLP